VHSSRTELWHLWLGAIGHHGNTKTVAALPWGHQLPDLNLVQPQESRILPCIQSDLQKPRQVVGNPFMLWLCYWAPGRQQEPCRYPIQVTRQWDQLWKACGTTFGYHVGGTIRQMHVTNHRGPGFQPIFHWSLSDAISQANCRLPWYLRAENKWRVIAGRVIYASRIYIPAVDSLHSNVISWFHNNPQSSHFGALKTAELVSRDFHW